VDRTLKSTRLLVEILSLAGADVFLSGATGRNYLEESRFADAGIELRYLDFHPEPYPQRWPGFVPNLSALDLVFNVPTEECHRRVSAPGEAGPVTG
jgi:hypothetical protein